MIRHDTFLILKYLYIIGLTHSNTNIYFSFPWNNYQNLTFSNVMVFLTKNKIHDDTWLPHCVSPDIYRFGGGW